ncbi:MULTISPECIES: FtsX-like permease family protein [unclassified Candidatus Cardinium]|uniref:ABC transporter permease n=1 Tax=unclassified Candidatus Cardinium TaxID=2641185 RepID=UPI001FB4C7A5|nr:MULTISPECIES: FtsX-like permease family protein [unclassified Candidatus Cardinium]
MLSFQTIGWITLVANRFRQCNRDTFAASIDKIVTLSITVGTTAILIAVMVMLGFQKEIRKKITAFGGDFEITQYGGVQHPYEPTPIQASQVSRLMAYLPSCIKKITPFTQKIMLVRTKESVEGVLCKGMDPMVADTTLATYLIAGRLPNLTKATHANELCISHRLAQKLSIQLGGSVVVHTIYPSPRYRKLKIVGIYRTYLTDIDENLAFCDMRLLQRLNNWSSEMINGYTIFLKDHLKPIKAWRDTILPLIDYGLVLVSTQRKYASFYDWLTIIQKNTAIFILFVLLIGGCTMVATMMIQLMERSYMVGVLKVLGAYNWQINAILLYNSLRTLCFGMVYGNLLGIGLCLLQNHYRLLRLEPALYYMRYIPIYIDWQTILYPNLAIIAALLLALCLAINCLKHKKVVEALQEG